MTTQPFRWTQRVVMHGRGPICPHWYSLRRLVWRCELCRKCEAGIEKITRELLAKMEADYRATVLSTPEPTTTYPPERTTHRGFLNIEGS